MGAWGTALLIASSSSGNPYRFLQLSHMPKRASPGWLQKTRARPRFRRVKKKKRKEPERRQIAALFFCAAVPETRGLPSRKAEIRIVAGRFELRTGAPRPPKARIEAPSSGKTTSSIPQASQALPAPFCGRGRNGLPGQQRNPRRRATGEKIEAKNRLRRRVVNPMRWSPSSRPTAWASRGAPSWSFPLFLSQHAPARFSPLGGPGGPTRRPGPSKPAGRANFNGRPQEFLRGVGLLSMRELPSFFGNAWPAFEGRPARCRRRPSDK